MKDRLLAELDARIARHASGDSSGVLEDQALALVAELTTLGDPDAGSIVRVAALHLCRYEALPPEDSEIDLRLARTLYTNLHAVDPRLVSQDVREFFGLASPHDTGVALMDDYERTGQLDQLDRAISLFRQEMLERQTDRANGLYRVGMALFRRFERTGQRSDLDEAIELSRNALAAAARRDPRRAGFQSALADGLLSRFELTGDMSDVDEAVAVRREVVEFTASSPDHTDALLNLAAALSRRFGRTGQRRDRDEVTELRRAAEADGRR
jgi:tetratricopeptide (TPR) repeat protein